MSGCRSSATGAAWPRHLSESSGRASLPSIREDMNKERVLITLKTYPTLSRKYGETVRTAGVREDGTWVSIYPVPFRRLDEAEQ